MRLGKDDVLDMLRRESSRVFANTDVMQPELFDDVGEVYDWRNYVPESIKKVWNKLDERERRLVMLTCDVAAHSEKWD